MRCNIPEQQRFQPQGNRPLGRPDRVSEGNTGSSKKLDGIWNRYNLKSAGRIYAFGVLKRSEKFKVLDLCKSIILN